ncbi:MAG: hypothetical protein HYX76_07295 [Acidobacteria bacterium]|nr:hypothetical protein [Acidobacteriota bacterium]
MRAVILSLVTALSATSAVAQEIPTIAGGPRKPTGILTDYNFHLNAAYMAIDDPRFTWDADFGGDLDVIDYGAGRANFLANYEAVLGEELRSFDLNQGIYTLDLRGTLRRSHSELAGVFHHVSRHLSDRSKIFPIDWNMIGVEYRHLRTQDRLSVIGTAHALVTTARSFVDYTSEWNLAVGVRYSLDQHLAAIAGGRLTLVSVDRATFDRGMQSGGRVEVGVQVPGPAGRIDIFLAAERRIDADPLERLPHSWALVGFRLRGLSQ